MLPLRQMALGMHVVERFHALSFINLLVGRYINVALSGMWSYTVSAQGY